MATAVTGILSLFADLGLSAAVVQSRVEPTHAQSTSLFWVNLLLGAALAVLLLFAAPLVSAFFNEPRVLPICAVMALGFPVSALAVQHHAILQREMRFHALSLIEVLSGTAAAASSITLAYLGFDYWAIVTGSLMLVATKTIAVWLVCPWRPSRMSKGTHVRWFLVFGGSIVAFNVLNYASRTLDNVLIGRRWGAAALGLYSNAYSLVLLPLNLFRGPVNSVMIPALSRLQDSREAYRAVYLKGVTAICALAMPVYAFLMVFADETIHALFGAAWADAAPILRLLSIAGFVQTLTMTKSPVYVSLHQERRQLQAAFVTTVATVVAFAIGLPWGALGVAYSYAAVNLLVAYPALWHCLRYSPISLPDLARAGVWPSLASLFLAAAALLVKALGAAPTSPWLLLLYAVAGMVLYGLACVLVPTGRRLLRRTFRETAEMLAGAARASTRCRIQAVPEDRP